MKNNGLGLIARLQSFDALHTGPMCFRGLVIQFTRDESKFDNYELKCRAKEKKNYLPVK